MTTRTAVLTILMRAEGNEWFTIEELRYITGATRRDIEETIQDLRLSGSPIIGGAQGVRYTLDPDEIRQYATGRRRRLVSIALGTRALLRAARRLDTSQPDLGL